MGPLALSSPLRNSGSSPSTQNPKTPPTLHDFLHPEEIFHYSLRAINGKLTPVPSDGRGGGMLAPGLELDDSVFSPSWPSFPLTALELCITNDPYAAISASPNKVLITLTGKKEICFVKLYQAGDTNTARRELATYKQITESDLDRNVRICRLLGLIRDDQNQLIGLPLTYIDCDFVSNFVLCV
jgi:hypothetical protein